MPAMCQFKGLVVPCVELTIGLISGCGTASNLWKSSLSSGPMLMYAPLFSVLSQYLGAEKTRHFQLASVAGNWRPLTRNALPVVLFLISFHPHFMATNDGFKAVVLTKTSL